jgi:methylated-DNA-protein-cysteine methyltransferase related protein
VLAVARAGGERTARGGEARTRSHLCPDPLRRERPVTGPPTERATSQHGGGMRQAEQSFSSRVGATVRRIPYGRVSAYGEIAALMGTPRAARGVGHALSALPHGSDIPWWRVVNARGEISIGHHARFLQRMLLEQEGVRFGPGGRIDMSRYGWKGEATPYPDTGRREGEAAR